MGVSTEPVIFFFFETLKKEEHYNEEQFPIQIPGNFFTAP